MGERNLMRERELDPGASPAAFFGNEVREARTAAKMSQPALGAAVGYDGTYVSKVETGTIVPDDDFVNGLDGIFPHMNGWFTRFWSQLSQVGRTVPGMVQRLDRGGRECASYPMVGTAFDSWPAADRRLRARAFPCMADGRRPRHGGAERYPYDWTGRRSSTGLIRQLFWP